MKSKTIFLVGATFLIVGIIGGVFLSEVIKRTPPAPIASLADQKQCATDGAAFYQTWWQDYSSYDYSLETPEYYYNATRGMCLAYLSTSHLLPNNNSSSLSFLYVYSVYENRLVLQSETTRDCSQTPCTDTVSENPIYTDIPNLSNFDFFTQKAVLFGQ